MTNVINKRVLKLHRSLSVILLELLVILVPLSFLYTAIRYLSSAVSEIHTLDMHQVTLCYRVLCFQPEFQPLERREKVRRGKSTTLLTGVGGLAPLAFTITAGAWPPGFKLDPHTGIVSGTTNAPVGVYDLSVKVESGLGTVEAYISIEVIDS